MYNEGFTLTSEYWQAIIHNDSSYDNKFFYAVKSTGIFCRPSCKSRIPNKNNVRIFLNAEQALHENFRPCKRCKPNGITLPNEEWVEQIKNYIEKHYDEGLTLDLLAEMCHGSPFHLQRTFKRLIGISPIEYIQRFRIVKAAEFLSHTNQSIKEISTAVGIENPEYFATLFKTKTGFTPTEYRKKNEMKEGYNNEFHKNKSIYWTLFTHENWNFHIAATENGLCFIGSQDENFEELNIWARKKLPQHVLVCNPDYLQTYTKEVIEYLENKRETFTFPVDAHGTAFQLSVWNTVREIPYGKTYSYSEIAERIQKPTAVRAVASAIAANPLLITIPCHRVIGKNGKLTGFRGGLKMKKELLTLEKLQVESI